METTNCLMEGWKRKTKRGDHFANYIAKIMRNLVPEALHSAATLGFIKLEIVGLFGALPRMFLQGCENFDYEILYRDCAPRIQGDE